MSYRRPSTESSDSFEFISPRRSPPPLRNIVHDDLSSDEDQIVWNVMGAPLSSPPSLSDDDFILLNVPTLSPPPSLLRKDESILNSRKDDRSNRAQGNSSPKCNVSRTNSGGSTTSPATPSSPRKNRRHRGHMAPVAKSPETPMTSVTTRQLPSSSSKKKQPARGRASNKAYPPPAADRYPSLGLGARSIVDDISEWGDDPSAMTTTIYEQAVRYINCFLSEPMDHKAAHLTLLQALIIELGFFTPLQMPETPTSTTPTPSTASTFSLSDLPHSMREAKSFIKENVFLNVRDYMAVRAQGREALQSVLHPSRRSLVTQLRKKSSRAPRDWVKERGLNVLLVSCH